MVLEEELRQAVKPVEVWLALEKVPELELLLMDELVKGWLVFSFSSKTFLELLNSAKMLEDWLALETFRGLNFLVKISLSDFWLLQFGTLFEL